MDCPKDGCDGTLEATAAVFFDVNAATVMGQNGEVLIEDLTFAHLNDELDGHPCTLESEFSLSCTEGHGFVPWFGEALRQRMGLQPIGNADRTLGTRGGLPSGEGTSLGD